MGQAPATGRISLRTVPRNFPGRSGTKEDQVYLCSPETVAASALTGVITDPRTLDMEYPKFEERKSLQIHVSMVNPPPKDDDEVKLEKGPNIQSLPEMEPPPETLEGPVLIKVGDDISTDEIMPAGSRVLPYRSNIPEISKFVFEPLDREYYQRAMEHREGGSYIVGGKNYGQGSSREHAALAPRYLGVKAVFAKSYARIHFQNLANFGILPLVFANSEDWDKIQQGDVLAMEDIHNVLRDGKTIKVTNRTQDDTYEMRHSLTARQVEMILEGSLINIVRREHQSAD
jgi:aconitate hydratase